MEKKKNCDYTRNKSTKMSVTTSSADGLLKNSEVNYSSEYSSKDTSQAINENLSSKKRSDSSVKEFKSNDDMHGVKPKVNHTKKKAKGEHIDGQQVNRNSSDYCVYENKKGDVYTSQDTGKYNSTSVPRSNNFRSSAYVGGNNVWNSHTISSESTQKSVWKNLKDDMYRTVNTYKKSKSVFSVTYNKWLKERKENLEKLHSLIKDIHNDQLNFNKAQLVCRSAGQASRTLKANSTTDAGCFFTGLSAFLSDVASGIASVAQVINVESYRDTFQEIVEKDAKLTKLLYDARTKCDRKYKDIEEVMQNFHTNSMNSTVATISNALQVGKFWVAVKTAKQNDDLVQALNIVGNFVGQACNPEVLGKIHNSIATYADDNRAVFDVGYAAGRAIGGAIDTFITQQSDKSRLNREASRISNLQMAKLDQLEINRLSLSIEQNLSQTKLEDQIQDKIDSLEKEMEEIINDYYRYLQDGISDDDCSDDEKFFDANDNNYSSYYNGYN